MNVTSNCGFQRGDIGKGRLLFITVHLDEYLAAASAMFEKVSREGETVNLSLPRTLLKLQ
jgi:hypothetical protein